jgi:ferredoxin, 2Fe-2S
MTKIVYVHPSGKRDTLEVADGLSVMQAATSRGVDGILAECGGNAMCATCHVYVDADWLGRLPPMSAEEDALLDGTASERRADSRLSCQLKIGPELDGLIVHLPERQT